MPRPIITTSWNSRDKPTTQWEVTRGVENCITWDEALFTWDQTNLTWDGSCIQPIETSWKTPRLGTLLEDIQGNKVLDLQGNNVEGLTGEQGNLIRTIWN